uniref:Uncharacterized protein n=1 Tax=Meloidogyne enterolobii TaxID=390850 RepID=A0A6V7W827_MELEN|nr:unnamed protein product [Meloidogyne enterolobii]
MQELRQRFDKLTGPDDEQVQPVQKEKQKERLSFFQRKDAFMKECQKRFARRIFVPIVVRSAAELLNDRKLFPVEEYCDRPSSQYNCDYGCQHTKSCEALFAYTPEQMELAARFAPETPDFLTKKSKLETLEKPDDEEKSSEYCDEAIDQRACSDQHLAELDPKQQLQTTAGELASVMQELRQRFDNRTTAKDVPVQSVQKEEQKEQLNYRQRKDAFIEKYDYVFWSRSAPQLSNDRKKFPKEEWCDRPSSQYECANGGCCQHTQSCQSLFVYSPEEMKLAVEWDSETPDFLTEKSKRETMEKLDDEDRLSVYSDYIDIDQHIDQCTYYINHPAFSSRRLAARSNDYLTPADAVTADGQNDKEAASNLTTSSVYFGQSSENFGLEPLLGSLEDINSTKTCLQATHQRNYFLDEDYGWYWENVSSESVYISWESIHTMKEELDPVEGQFYDYSVLFSPSFDDFFNGSASEEAFFDVDKLSVYCDRALIGSASTGDLGTSISQESFYCLPTKRIQLRKPASPSVFKALFQSSDSDMESVPSSIQSSVSLLLSPLEAREEVRKLALQANNVDDFFELIPDNLLDNFFSDYKMLVRHKMLEEQCDNIREELMKQPKKLMIEATEGIRMDEN